MIESNETPSQYPAKSKKSQHPGQGSPFTPAFKAMQFAAAGIIVHELNGKIPVAGDWNSRTVAPTTAEIRDWHYGCNYGVLTGSRNRNLVVIDLDTPEMITLFEQKFSHLRDTYIVKTRRGEHRYYYCDQLPPTTKIPGQIELMADDADGLGGKNVVGEGSIHESGHVYTGNGKKIMRGVDLADVVAWIESLKPARPTAKVSPHRISADGDLSRYYAKILHEETAAIASAPDGAGNDTVYRASLKIFGAVDEGGIPEHIARAEIDSALAGWTYRKSGDRAAIERTIESAWQGRAGGRNGRNPRAYEPTRPTTSAATEIAVEAESSTMVENATHWVSMPDAVLSSILRNVPTIAPLARIIVKSGLRVFSREQIKAVATARGMSESKFNHDWPLLFSPELQVLECIYGEIIDSNSCNYRVIAVHRVIEQLRPLDMKWVYRVCHPIGPPPEPGHEDRRKVARVTDEMLRDSGIEDVETVGPEIRQKLSPYAEKRAEYRAIRVLKQLEASYFDPRETNIPQDAETHTVAALRTALLNAYVADRPGERMSRFDIRLLTGASDSSVKAMTTRAGVVGESPAELPALAIRSAADIDRILPHQGTVKGYPVQVTYERDGETVTRGIDFRRDARGARRVCEMALQSGTAVKVLYQTAKEYHVESAPLPTKERVKVEVEQGERASGKYLPEAPDQPETEPSDPRKYPRRWLVGQYQLALERMGWKRNSMGLYNSDGERAPDNPRELIELILGRPLAMLPKADTDPDYYERPSTDYELNARHFWRQDAINEGFTKVVHP